jgi:hypothetical protein
MRAWKSLSQPCCFVWGSRKLSSSASSLRSGSRPSTLWSRSSVNGRRRPQTRPDWLQYGNAYQPHTSRRPADSGRDRGCCCWVSLLRRQVLWLAILALAARLVVAKLSPAGSGLRAARDYVRRYDPNVRIRGMRRFTLTELVIVSVLLASAMSAATCIIPRGLTQAVAEWHENPTPEAAEAMRQANRWPLREHAILAALLTFPFGIVVGIFNLALPIRSPDRGWESSAEPESR